MAQWAPRMREIKVSVIFQISRWQSISIAGELRHTELVGSSWKCELAFTAKWRTGTFRVRTEKLG